MKTETPMTCLEADKMIIKLITAITLGMVLLASALTVHAEADGEFLILKNHQGGYFTHGSRDDTYDLFGGD